MSGTRYFSETTSELVSRRLKPVAGASTEGLRKVIAEGEKEGLSDYLLAPLREQLEKLEGKSENISDEEVEILRDKIRSMGFSYYGVEVSNEAIFFEDCQEGNLYTPGDDLVALFDTVKDTVLFSGVVEVWATDIEDYVRLEITDSTVTNQQTAKITWV